MAEEARTASGVQELISKLKDEGVKAGKEEAARILDDAQSKAVQILSDAKKQSEEILKKARNEIEADRSAAKESLRVAFRETELMLESQLKTVFADHVKRLVSVELKDKEFLKQLILILAGQLKPETEKSKDIEVLLSSNLFKKEGTEVKLTEEGKEEFKHFVLGISGDMLREGVKIKSSEDGMVGLKIKIVGKDVEIDLSDNAISELLLKYLLPRYRAIVAGAE